MTVPVRLAVALRAHAGDQAVVQVGVVAPTTIGEVLDALALAHPAVGRRIRDERGALRRHVNVFVGSDNIRDLDGLNSTVAPGVEVAVLPAVSGG